MNTNDKEFCRRIEKIIFIDPGKRGIEQCFIYDSLYRAAEGILKCDKKKISYLLTGFCCMHDTCETDGPLGSSVLCSLLRAMGFNTSILCDTFAEKVTKAAAFPNPVTVANSIEEIDNDISFAISIERPGRAEKTNDYRTMKARDISKVTAPLDFLFPNVKDKKIKPYLTISVGDGGNEVGTGNIIDLIKKNVPLGDSICTISSCDILIMAGVSKLGGVGIAAALSILANDEQIARTFIDIMSTQKEILKRMIDNGSYDGVSGDYINAIDGMMFEKEHGDVNNKIIEIIKEKYIINN